MISGVKFQIHPNEEQRKVLSQWMGAQRFIWNAKVQEEKYLRVFARKYLPVGTWPEADQTYSQYKSKELCPWIYDIPSQILRNGAVRWFKTFNNFLSGECGRPRIKRKKDTGSVYITRELFQIERKGKSVLLHLGTKKNSLGLVAVNAHREFSEPASITIKRSAGKWTLSFSFGEEEEKLISYQKDCLSLLRESSPDELEAMVVGIDRGVAVPFQAGDKPFDHEEKAKRKHAARLRYMRGLQKRLARQEKGSSRHKKTKHRIAKVHASIQNVRHDFLHKTTFELCASDHKVFIIEDLRVKNMSKAPEPKPLESGKGFAKNGARAKAGLNKVILAEAWGRFETILHYKSRKFGKVTFKVSPQFTSQECAACASIHPESRRSQSDFHCLACGHRDNADRNAALVIKKRAISLILDSGAELSERGVLVPGSDIGRRAIRKTRKAKAIPAEGDEASKKKRKSPKALPSDFSLEASPLQG
jgi:putative transposase